MTEPAPPGWEGILTPGERILWQGRPAQGIFFTGKVSDIVMGLVMTGFALFWTAMAFWEMYQDGFPSILMPLFGLFFVYQGLGLAGGFALWDAYKRSRTWYTLSDQRAFIATAILGQKTLRDWHVSAFGEVVLDHGPPAAVWFASAQRGKNKRVGFSDIDDAHKVMTLIREMQKDTTA